MDIVITVVCAIALICGVVAVVFGIMENEYKRKHIPKIFVLAKGDGFILVNTGENGIYKLSTIDLVKLGEHLNRSMGVDYKALARGVKKLAKETAEERLWISGACRVDGCQNPASPLTRDKVCFEHSSFNS